MIGREHFGVSVGSADTHAQILTGFVKQYYSGTPFVPKELWIQEELEDQDVIEKWLSTRRGQRVHILVPKRARRNVLWSLRERTQRWC